MADTDQKQDTARELEDHAVETPHYTIECAVCDTEVDDDSEYYVAHHAALSGWRVIAGEPLCPECVSKRKGG